MNLNWLGLIGGLTSAAIVGELVTLMGDDDVAGLVAIPFYFGGLFFVEFWQKSRKSRKH